jgi:hypothetical protein
MNSGRKMPIIIFAGIIDENICDYLQDDKLQVEQIIFHHILKHLGNVKLVLDAPQKTFFSDLVDLCPGSSALLYFAENVWKLFAHLNRLFIILIISFIKANTLHSALS